MAVFRVERTRDYTVMCNHHLKDSNLSLKAKGLLSMMLSLPDEWNYTTRGLAAICKEGVDAIGKTLKELELAGYIIRRQLRGKDGRISDTEYTIFEKPRKPSPPDTTLPDTENPYLDNVDHRKLLKQIWTLGIRDTKLIQIIKAMLKAPIEMPDGETILPSKGTPQGGILSPLLANIVLNELDWWIASQWDEMVGHMKHPCTGKKKGCAHPVMLKESSLIDCVRDSLKAYIGNIASLEALLTGIDQSSINQALAKEYSDHITDNERRLEQVLEFKARLYESLVGGMLTKEEYASYKAKYTKQAEDIRESVRVLKEKLTEVLENRSERNRWISQFTQFSTLETLDRRALIHMVQSIRVRGKKELDITFTHEDEYKKALQLLALAAQQKDYKQRKVG